jgi:hypothetical protein
VRFRVGLLNTFASRKDSRIRPHIRQRFFYACKIQQRVDLWKSEIGIRTASSVARNTVVIFR